MADTARRRAQVAGRMAIGSGRIWTAGGLMDLLGNSRLTLELAMSIARAKLEFGSEAVAVRPREARP